MKKRFLSAILAAAMLMSVSACGSGNNSGTPANGAPSSQTVTFAEKNAYVEENYPEFYTNDFRLYLPFDDIIGLPLAELKNAVETSGKFSEETSMWSEFSEIAGSGFNVDIAYAFSDRTFNSSGSSEGSFWDNIISHATAGAKNILSTMGESATYCYVITDGSSKQLITQVFICRSNTGKTANELDSELSSVYLDGELVSDSGIPFRSYVGIISDIDCEGIYNYDHGLSSKLPDCMGCLNHFFKDDVMILQIASVNAYA